MSPEIERILYLLPGIIIGLTFHELMHAFVALKLGDSTARDQGRLTLNPIKHIDPLGFIFILIAGFGWAKPVQINRANLKHPRRDDALIAVAGPTANLVLALALSVVYSLILNILNMGYNESQNYPILMLFINTIAINYVLFLFNMLPIPPLDGSHLIFSAIRIKPETEAKLYRYGMLVLLGILVLGRVLNINLLPIGPVLNWIMGSVLRLLGVHP
jgi:Zn-dependent protease